MKKILLRLSVASAVILLSGCTYHSASLDYAKKNGLSEDIYSDVKIQCVTKEKLNGKKNNDMITKAIGEDMYSTCDYDSRSMKKTHPLMGMQKYNACIGLANSTNVYSNPEKLSSTVTINNVQTKNMYEKKEFGYWGNETVGNKTILFTNGGILDTALANYVKNNNMECGEFKNEVKEDSIGNDMFKTLKKYYWRGIKIINNG
jgi:hypothetical protein